MERVRTSIGERPMAKVEGKHEELVRRHKTVKEDLSKTVRGQRVSDPAHMAHVALKVIEEYEEYAKMVDEGKIGNGDCN